MEYYYFEVVFLYHSGEFALCWVQTILGFGSRRCHSLFWQHFCRRNTKVHKHLHITSSRRNWYQGTAAKLLFVHRDEQ